MKAVNKVWVLGLVAILFSLTSIVLALTSYDRMVTSCVDVTDTETSGNHFIMYQGGFLAAKYLPPESVINYYRQKMDCINRFSLFETNANKQEWIQFESLQFVKYVEDRDKNTGKQCVVLTSNRKVCTK